MIIRLRGRARLLSRRVGHTNDGQRHRHVGTSPPRSVCRAVNFGDQIFLPRTLLREFHRASAVPPNSRRRFPHYSIDLRSSSLRIRCDRPANVRVSGVAALVAGEPVTSYKPSYRRPDVDVATSVAP